MNVLNQFFSTIEKSIRPATLPIAIKMLKSERDIPSDIKRPGRDFGIRLLPCQAFYLSRKHGIPVAMLREDFNTEQCPVGSIAFGVAPPIDWWSRGNVAHEVYTKTLKAAETMEKNLFRFKYGKYVGFVTAPLDKVNFDPDMILLYCNSAQAMSLVSASRYEDGLPLNTRISARAVCSDSVVQTIQTGRCHVSIPCGGDRALAFAGAEEIVFTAPVNKLRTIIEGLESLPRTRAPAIFGLLGKRISIMDRKYMELARLIEKQAESKKFAKFSRKLRHRPEE